MAIYPKTVTFGKMAVLIGDGATPEVFSAPCGFTDKALRVTGSTGTTVVPACDDPDAAAWEEKLINSLSWQVTGSGVLAINHLDDWRTWMFDGTENNVRVQFAVPAADGGGFYSGSAVLTSLEHNATRGERAKISVTIEGSGPLAWTAAT